MDTVLATTDTPVLDTTATTARGPLMLSPLPLLRLIPTTDTTATVLTDTVLATTDTDTVLDTVATTVATTARGPLTPSPLPPLMPRLIPTTDTTATDTTIRIRSWSWIPRLRIRSWPLRLRPWSVRILRISSSQLKASKNQLRNYIK